MTRTSRPRPLSTWTFWTTDEEEDACPVAMGPAQGCGLFVPVDGAVLVELMRYGSDWRNGPPRDTTWSQVVTICVS